MTTAVQFQTCSYWPTSPSDPELWTVVEFVQGDDESPSDDWPEKIATADMILQEAAGWLRTSVWWRPIPW